MPKASLAHSVPAERTLLGDCLVRELHAYDIIIGYQEYRYIEESACDLTSLSCAEY